MSQARDLSGKAHTTKQDENGQKKKKQGGETGERTGSKVDGDEVVVVAVGDGIHQRVEVVGVIAKVARQDRVKHALQTRVERLRAEPHLTARSPGVWGKW